MKSYRRQQNGKHQLVVPQTLIQDVIRENHDPMYVAHPGIKRTYSLISLNYLCSKMRETIEQYVRRCDPCQKEREPGNNCPTWRRRGAQNSLRSYFVGYNWPLPNNAARKQVSPHFCLSLDKVCWGVSHPLSQDKTCARVCSSQIVTRHGSGSPWSRTKAENLSYFFQRTCKILGVRRVRTSSYHASSNGMLERLHRSLHSDLSHYVNANHKNWDEFVPFYLMSYRATPHTTTGYSPIYLFIGRKMVLSSNDNLKARLPKDNTDDDQCLEKPEIESEISLQASSES